MSGIAVITEACIDVKDRACVDVCPVQCIYEFDPDEEHPLLGGGAGSGDDREHPRPIPTIAIFGDTLLYVNMDECTVLHGLLPARRLPGRRDLHRGAGPDGVDRSTYNASDPNKGHDHTFFIEHSRAVFAD